VHTVITKTRQRATCGHVSTHPGGHLDMTTKAEHVLVSQLIIAKRQCISIAMAMAVGCTVTAILVVSAIILILIFKMMVMNKSYYLHNKCTSQAKVVHTNVHNLNTSATY
jgi:hypothetical protein